MKRFYHILSLMALIGLFALAGFVGFLFATGRLNAQRIDQIGIVLRGQFPAPPPPTSQPASQPATMPAPQPSRAEIARMQAQKEYYELAGERLRAEAQQRQSLNQRIHLDSSRQFEEADARRQEIQDKRKRQEPKPVSAEGMEKELEVIAAMDPKMARDLLMKRKEPDALQIFMRLESNRVKKIVDACKTEDERNWIGRILSQMEKMDSETANGVDGPNASS